jgi:hypothetical protein
MAQRKPDKPSVDQVLKLAEQLSPDEREELRLKLGAKSWAERWDALTKRVRQQSQQVEPITDEEIIAEMKAIRKDVWSERAQSGN